MFKKNNTRALMKRVEKVSSLIPTQNTLSFFENLTDAYKEHQISMRHIAELEAKKEYLIKEMENKSDESNEDSIKFSISTVFPS